MSAQRARKRVWQDALAFRRSTAALVAASERHNSAQAVLHAIKRMRALPAPSIALKRSTPRAGRNAGGNDARTAPAQVTNPRGGTAPCSAVGTSPVDALHMSKVTTLVTYSGTKSQENSDAKIAVRCRFDRGPACFPA